ncbi:hypothetical protein QBC34DRAFT_443643 [Podospora aff. communis PSN243]|uniref:Ubiquitin-like domain-containing protein n=1 Tax=Podospora aff. communis PSN243 TaxID=3040156 RepID=A0AAV9G3V4_9PEZI|nr:hypothetical protein QBC34DRAFT_443643 [Podospora aff. communis PSN243]
MAAPVFGFSAGDFINAVNLIIDITKALKSVGGARDDYQALVAELCLLQQVLVQLQHRQPSSGIGDICGPYARQQAELTISTLSEFLRDISKFDDALGSNVPRQWYRHVGRKAQWAVAYAKDVDALRRRIGNQLHVLNIILQLDERLDSSSRRILTTLEEIKGQNNVILQQAVSREAQFNPSCAKMRVLRVVQQNNFISLADRGGLTGGIDSEPRLSSQVMPSRGVIHRFTEQETLAMLLLKLVQVTARDLRSFLLSAWTFFPRLFFVLHGLSIRVCGEPLLVVSDSINFEDMLGRRYTLQHAYYCYWPNFEAFLERKFHNFPGETFVAGGHYSLLSSRTRTSIRSDYKSKWSRFSVPGCEISMSVRVKLARVDTLGGQVLGDCPWIECDGKNLPKHGWDTMKCPTCNITYVFRPNDKTTQYSNMYPGFIQTESREGKVKLGIVGQADVFRRAKRTQRILRWEWICCACGREGRDMGMLTVDCPAKSCGHSHCGNCPVQHVRRRRGATVIEYKRNPE